MQHRITKDCGSGWDEWCESGGQSWGVSERQHRVAANAQTGDIFLHFIDHVQAWAGYSQVIGPLRTNDRDSHADWISALPWVIPVRKMCWLKKNSCEATIDIVGLSHGNFYRQTAFSEIREGDSKIIMAAIDSAGDVSLPEPSTNFESKWSEGSEAYYSQIVKDRAGGECWLCKMTAASWMERAGLSEPLTDSIKNGFLDAAHIVPRRENGPMSPDNLRALCPNCHRIVDRLDQSRCREILERRRN